MMSMIRSIPWVIKPRPAHVGFLWTKLQCDSFCPNNSALSFASIIPLMLCTPSLIHHQRYVLPDICSVIKELVKN
jgi:hypothetical protein